METITTESKEEKLFIILKRKRDNDKTEEENGKKLGLTLLVKKLSPEATLPTRGSSGAAGYDLSSAKDCIVPARGKALVPTDLSIAIPYGTYARIGPRSGLAWKNSIDVGAGIVDFDYSYINKYTKLLSCRY